MQTPTPPAAAGKPASPIPRWLQACTNHARAIQASTLAHLQALDAAVACHCSHGAMAGADPLTDSLYGQLEGPAAEGAQDPLPYSAGRSQALAEAGRDPWLYWVMAAGAVAGVALSAVYPLGFAA